VIRGADDVGADVRGTVTLGAITLGVVTGAETEGIRIIERADGLVVGVLVLPEIPLLDGMTRTPDPLELDDPREELDDPRDEPDDPREELDDPRDELEDDWPLAGLIEDPREPR
jgi:hypothetical protein